MRFPSIFSNTEDNDNNNENTEPSWKKHKENGKHHFENGNYEEALASWNEALKVEYEAPDSERQILLSNLVACRLKIGGNDMAEAAVEEAKQVRAIFRRVYMYRGGYLLVKAIDGKDVWVEYHLFIIFNLNRSKKYKRES